MQDNHQAPEKSHLKIALWQVNPPSSVEEAISGLHDAAAKAQAAEADLLLTPEMAMSGYNIGTERVEELAEAPGGTLFETIQKLARTSGVAIAYGYPERSAGQVFNSVQLINSDGQRIGNYRKTHLFGDVDRLQFSAGQALPNLVNFHGWKLAMGICYDIEFPEFCRSYALMGADILLVPTANMSPFDMVNKTLVPARAIENTMGMAYCNYVGSEPPFDYCGQSVAVDADGSLLATGSANETGLLVATFTRASLEKARCTQSYLRDRREDLYLRHTDSGTTS